MLPGTRAYAALFWLLASASGHAGVVTLDERYRAVPLAGEFATLAAEESDGIPVTLPSRNAADWSPRTLDRVNFGTANSTLWVRIEFSYQLATNRQWLLVLDGSRLSAATLFTPGNDGYDSGVNYLPTLVRGHATPVWTFNLPPSGSVSQPLYLRLSGSGVVPLRPSVWDAATFFQASGGGKPADPVYSLLVVFLVVSLFVALAWRERFVFSLVCFFAGALLYLAFAEGTAYQLAWLARIGGWIYAPAFFAALTVIAASIANRKAVRAADNAPRLHALLIVVEYGLLGLALASISGFAVPPAVLILAATTAIYLVGGLLITTSFLAWRKGERWGAFMGTAWVVFAVFAGYQQIAAVSWPGFGFFERHGLHAAILLASLLISVGYIDRIMGYRRSLVEQVADNLRTGRELRVERARRDFAQEVNAFMQTLDPGMYEEGILTCFLEHLHSMMPIRAAAVAISHRGDVRLVVTGEDIVTDSFESVLATREQLLQSVCLSDASAVIHSNDFGIDDGESGPSCLGIVPVHAARNDWAGVLLARAGENQFSLDELQTVREFADQAYDAVRSAQQFRRVRRDAETDALTRLFNRRALMIRAKRQFRKARSLGEPLSLLFIDIDHFKRVNDDWGHDVGDRVLREIAKICTSCIRDDDFIGRFGGEEFLAILPGADTGVADQVAERIRESVESERIRVCETDLNMTVSIGIAEDVMRFASFETMWRAADRALYQAKREGRNRVVYHRYLMHGDRVAVPMA